MLARAPPAGTATPQVLRHPKTLLQHPAFQLCSHLGSSSDTTGTDPARAPPTSPCPPARAEPRQGTGVPLGLPHPPPAPKQGALGPPSTLTLMLQSPSGGTGTPRTMLRRPHPKIAGGGGEARRERREGSGSHSAVGMGCGGGNGVVPGPDSRAAPPQFPPFPRSFAPGLRAQRGLVQHAGRFHQPPPRAAHYFGSQRSAPLGPPGASPRPRGHRGHEGPAGDSRSPSTTGHRGGMLS